MAYVQVAVDVPVRTHFTYKIPLHLQGRVESGSRVYVPFRGRPRAGLAVDRLARPVDPSMRIESVIDVLDADPVVPTSILELMDWVSRYYFAPPGEVMRLVLPKALRVKGKRRVSLTEAGRAYLTQTQIPSEFYERVLRQIPETRPISDVALRKAVKGLTYAKLDELAQHNFVELQWSAVDPGRGTKRVKTLEKLADPSEGQRVGARQRAVLDALEGRGTVPSSEVRELTNASYATIRSLVARGWVREGTEERYRDPFKDDSIAQKSDFALTEEQDVAVKAILGDGSFSAFGGFLLHGITGSGKTAVYLQVIKAAVAAGRQALVLLPEISLTPQFVAIFRAHFGQRVAVLHSGLNDGERYDEWRRIRKGVAEVVIGARSAIFAPLDKLAVLVVDEEHDGSFKQDSGVRYNARDVALVRGQQCDARVILGSATPSLESLHLSRTGKLTRLALSRRPTGQPLPEVELVDMRLVGKDDTGKTPLISSELESQLKAVVERGQQSILFLNRRGHSTTVLCNGCGESWKCPHCEITLTYHRRPSRLKCHYCDYTEPLPELCPACASPEWIFFGAGTEKVSDQIPATMGGLRILRLDRDTANRRNMREIIQSFRDGQADVLVGTQMVAKGHDFPYVTLVGVLMADLSLRIPDFRSGERTFQLLAQVAGRAGRREHKGKVIIQTFLPEHPVVQAASNQDYAQFSEAELYSREALGYPPFGHLIAIRFEGPDLRAIRKVADRYEEAASRALLSDPRFPSDVRVLGPVESPLARLKDQFRWQMLAQSRSRATLRAFVGRLLSESGFALATRLGVHVIVDVDPQHLS